MFADINKNLNTKTSTNVMEENLESYLKRMREYFEGVWWEEINFIILYLLSFI